jgi:hypothetical protein
MSLKNLFGNAASKALIVSLLGACAIGGIPVKAANAANLEQLYRTQMALRKCKPAPEAKADDAAKTAPSIAASGEKAGKLNDAIEEQVAFSEPDESDFDAIFNRLNDEVAADVASFCAASVPVATQVLGSLN